MRLALVLMIAACAKPPRPAEPEPAHESTPMDPWETEAKAPAPTTDAPTGAVPIPGERDPAPLSEIDTTVTDAELASITGWPAAKKNPRGGDIWLVLRTDGNSRLQLSVVENDRGVVADYPLGRAAPIQSKLTFDGNTYPSRDHSGDYTGPIIFAVRVTAPGETTPEQLVVFQTGSILRVVRRPLGAPAWSPALVVRFTAGATFHGIGTTDPH